MAVRSHSRFTDEIFCTPAPTAAQIEVRTIDVLREEIFPEGSPASFREGLHSAEELKAKELYENYPPNFKDKNKNFIFDRLNHEQRYLPSDGKSILITRWKPFVPMIESEDFSKTKVDFRPNVFDYKPTSDHHTVEWHLNFANSDLFAYYGGSLLAQDELQVLECVELGALREYLVQTTNSVGTRTVGSTAQNNKSVPTPILISNTERVIDLDTTDIYGNAFAKASEEQLSKACHLLTPVQKVNLIAIEALSYGKGPYTPDQIQYTLTACYTGFKAAQLLANKTHALNADESTTRQRRASQSGSSGLRTVIHTGWWGCGAYGNNRQMMLITQILAAYWAQIDEIVFHTQNNEHRRDIDEAMERVEELTRSREVEEVAESIVSLNLEWDKSNNT